MKWNSTAGITDGRRMQKLRASQRRFQRTCASRPITEPMEQRTLLSAAALDMTFGTGGSVLIPAGNQAYGAAVAVQPNGQIDLLTTTFPGSPLRVTRLKANGSLDGTFGTNGVATLPVSASGSQAGAGTLLVQPNGDILVSSGKTLARLTPAGTLDTTFAAGKGYESLPNSGSATSAALQSDGKILVLGGGSVYRFNTNGSLDTSYGVNGIATLSAPNFQIEESGGIAIDSAGRAVVSLGGTGTTSDILGEFVLERLTTAGKIDKTFGVNGSVNDGGQSDDAGGSAVAIAPNGTIYLAANYDEFEGDDMSFLYKCSANGTNLTGGMQSNANGILSLLVQPNNALVEAGYVFAGPGGNNTNVLIVDDGGAQQIDYTTGVDNRQTSDYGDFGWSVALQPDGKIVVAGSTNNVSEQNVTTNEFTVSRLTNDITTANGSISGTVYNDANQNRVQNTGEQGLAGWSVYLDLSNTGTYNSDDPITTTNASGHYSFSGLSAGTYIPRVIPPPGWVQTTPLHNYGPVVTLGQDGIATGASFGFYHAPIVVNSTADSANFIDPITSSKVTLRDAITQANAALGPVAITFSPTVFAAAKTITLSGENLEMSDPGGLVSITGPKAGLTISGNHFSRAFMIDPGATVTLSGLTIISGGYNVVGEVVGGGILNDGTLTLSNCTITRCVATYGGGIANSGILTVLQSTISDNSAVAETSDNRTEFGGGGGISSILSNGPVTLTIIGSTIAYNQAADGDTGIDPTPGVGSSSGGIYSTAGGSIVGTTFIGNYGYSHGGALGVNGTPVTLSNCTFTDNTCQYDGGAINVFDGGTVVVSGTTFNGNAEIHQANQGSGAGGGALYVEGESEADATNSTFVANAAPYGGAIAGPGTLNLNDCTITGNTASVAGGGVETAFGGAAGTITSNNTIIAGNHLATTKSTTSNDVDASISGFNNLLGFGNITGAHNGSQGNILGVSNPKLSPLGNYGGLTQTLVPLAGSPAIAAGSAAHIPSGVTTDQRGLPRVVGGRVDIGSVEIDKGGPFSGTPAPFGLIQAENFDFGGQNVAYFNPTNTNLGGQYRPNEGIGIGAIPTASGGGYDVGYTNPGEYLNYTVTVAATGTYTLSFRVASGVAGSAFHLNVDGVNVTGKLAIPNDGWNNYVIVSKTGVHLTAGTHVLRLVIDSTNATQGNGNFDWFEAIKT